MDDLDAEGRLCFYDNFNTTYWEMTSCSGTNDTWSTVNDLKYETVNGGVKISFNPRDGGMLDEWNSEGTSDLLSDTDRNYKNFSFYYTLKLTDAGVKELVRLQALWDKSGTTEMPQEMKVLLTNTAKVEKPKVMTSSVTSSFDSKMMTKSNLGADENNVITFKLDINPNEAEIGENGKIIVRDDMTLGPNDSTCYQLGYVPDSWTLETGSSAGLTKDQIKFRQLGDYVIEWEIPDGKHAVITYKTQIVGSTQGKNKIKNNASINGLSQNASVDQSFTAHTQGQGQSSVFSFTIYKRDATNNNKGLRGAEFTLYAADENGNKTPFISTIDGTTQIYPKFETQEDGKATITYKSGDGWSLYNHRIYYLEETKAPAGYNDPNRKPISIKFWTNDFGNEQHNPNYDEVACPNDAIVINFGQFITVLNGQKEIDLKKTMQGRPFNDGECYTFEIKCVSHPENDTDPPLPGNGTITLTGKAGEYEAVTSVPFSGFGYAGDYVYEIREKQPAETEQGMTYSGAVYKLTVKTQLDDQDQSVHIVVSYDLRMIKDQNGNPVSEPDGVEADGFHFINTYGEAPQTGSLAVTKNVTHDGTTTVTGGTGDGALDFTIVATLTKEDDTFMTADEAKGIAVTPDTVTQAYNAADGTIKFTLKSGQTATLTGLPQGTKWAVSESADGFDVTYTEYEGTNGDGKGQISQTDADTVTVNNRRGQLKIKKIVPDTGITTLPDNFTIHMKLNGSTYAGTVTATDGTHSTNITFADGEGDLVIPSSWMTNNQSGDITINGLPYGVTAEITEPNPGSGYVPVFELQTSGGETVTHDKATTEADGTPELVVVKNYPVGDLEVSKKLIGTVPQDKFSFTLGTLPDTTPDKDNAPGTQIAARITSAAGVEGTTQYYTVNGGSVTFELSAGEKIKFFDLPVQGYTVNETNGSGWTVTYSPESQDVNSSYVTVNQPVGENKGQTATVEVTNAKWATLRLVKQIADGKTDSTAFTAYIKLINPNTNAEFGEPPADGSASSDPFNYKYVLDDTRNAECGLSYATITNADGTTSHALMVTIQQNVWKQSITVPDGTKFEVWEAATAGWTPSYSVGGGTAVQSSASGTVSSAGETVVTITNTKTSGELKITKALAEGSETNDSFRITVKLTKGGSNLTGTFKCTSDLENSSNAGDKQLNGGELVFDIAPNETVTIGGLPEGTQYEVTESGKAGWTPSYASGDTDQTADGKAHGTVSANVTVTNSYTAAPVSLNFKATKSVTGNYTLADNKFEFELFETADATSVTPKENPLVNKTAKNNGEHHDTASFGEVEFSAAGTYYFVIREKEPAGTETDPTVPGITYDGKVYHITVSVGDDGKGSLVIDGVTSTGGTISYDQASDTVTTGTVTAGFTNAYQAGSTALTLKAKKTVTGTENITGYKIGSSGFAFNLYQTDLNWTKLTGENVLDETVAIPVDAEGAEATVEFAQLTYTTWNTTPSCASWRSASRRSSATRRSKTSCWPRRSDSTTPTRRSL